MVFGQDSLIYLNFSGNSDLRDVKEPRGKGVEKLQLLSYFLVGFSPNALFLVTSWHVAEIRTVSS